MAAQTSSMKGKVSFVIHRKVERPHTGQATLDTTSTDLGDPGVTFVLSHPSSHRLEAVCNLVTDALFVRARVVGVEVVMDVEDCPFGQSHDSTISC